MAFWSFIATLLALHALAEDPVPGAKDLPELSMDQVAAHNTAKDCWMVIEGKVYDFSAYIPQHPTPASVLTPWCGREATEGMRTKGYGRDHSPRAWRMLDDYLVGALAEEK